MVKLNLFQACVYRIYAIAKKLELTRFPVVQRLAVIIYDVIRPREKLCVETEGGKLFLKPEDRTITPVLIGNQGFEEFETDLCKLCIRPGMTVIDIGANIGYYTLLFAKLVGARGKVIGFEPVLDNFEFLQKNIELNNYSWVDLHRLALADKASEMDMYVGEISQTTSSFIKENILYESSINRVAVQSVALDEFLQERNIEKVDFIKLDVQGYEEAVVRGARNLLTSQNLSILMEFWPHGLQKAGTDIDRFLQMLEEFNFNFYVLDQKAFELHETCRKKLLSGLSFDDRYFINLFLRKERDGLSLLQKASQ